MNLPGELDKLLALGSKQLIVDDAPQLVATRQETLFEMLQILIA